MLNKIVCFIKRLKSIATIFHGELSNAQMIQNTVINKNNKLRGTKRRNGSVYISICIGNGRFISHFLIIFII